MVPAPVVEYIVPAPAVSYVASAPAVYAAQAPMGEYNASACCVIRGASTCCVRYASASGRVFRASAGRIPHGVSSSVNADDRIAVVQKSICEFHASAAKASGNFSAFFVRLSLNSLQSGIIAIRSY